MLRTAIPQKYPEGVYTVVVEMYNSSLQPLNILSAAVTVQEFAVAGPIPILGGNVITNHGFSLSMPPGQIMLRFSVVGVPAFYGAIGLVGASN